MSRKEFYLSLLLVFLLMFLYIPASLTIEGGIFLCVLGLVFFAIQLFRHSTFYISRGFVIVPFIFLYLFIYQFFLAKPVPVSYVTLHSWLLYSFLFLISYVSLRDEIDRKIWINALIAIAILISLDSIYEVLEWYFRYFKVGKSLEYLQMPQIAYRLKGNIFGHPNPLAGFLNFIWPLLFVRLYNSKNIKGKISWLLGLLVVAIAFVYTNSRGALLGTFAAVFVLSLSFVFEKGRGFKIKAIFENKKLKRSFFTIVGVLGVLLIGMLWRSVFTGQFFNRSFSGRGTIWKYSWQAFLETPLFGQGIGGFPVSYARLAQLPPGDFAPAAHNLWLQFGVNYGIVGLVFLCALILVFFFYAWKTLEQKNGEKLSYEIAYIAIGMAFLGQQIVDYMFFFKAYLIFFLVILIFLLKDVVLVGEWRLDRKSYFSLIMILLGLIVAYQTIVYSQVTSFSKRVEQSRLYNVGNWAALEDSICEDSSTHTSNSLYKFECATAIVQKMLLEQNSDPKYHLNEALDKAIYYQQAGFDLNPYWATQEANLAVLYWEKGEKTEALSLMENVVASAPASDIFLLNLGWMEETLGYEDAALDHYTRALRLNPMINISEFVRYSDLLPVAAEDLQNWMEADELWADWYEMDRHDRGPSDFLYWKGLIALSIGQNQSAIQYFEDSLDTTGSGRSIMPLAYAYQLAGQQDKALSVLEDTALFFRNEIVIGAENLSLASFVASILRENGETDIAYDFLLDAFENTNTVMFYRSYYIKLYEQQIVDSGISPLMIRNYNKPASTHSDWEWFVEETRRRGNIELAARVESWLANMAGIAR